jgi:hypothetical protein
MAGEVEEEASKFINRLLREGLRINEIGVGRFGHKTFGLPGGSGFFTIRHEHGLPYVVHLAGEPGTAWPLARRLKEVLRAMGEKRAIINIPVGKKKLLSAARRTLHAEPYAEHDGHIFLLMEVNHGQHQS